MFGDASCDRPSLYPIPHTRARSWFTRTTADGRSRRRAELDHACLVGGLVDEGKKLLALRRPVEQEDDALVTEKLNRVYADDGGTLDLALSALPARVLEPEEWSFAEKLGGAISQSRLDPSPANAALSW